MLNSCYSKSKKIVLNLVDKKLKKLIKTFEKLDLDNQRIKNTQTEKLYKIVAIAERLHLKNKKKQHDQSNTLIIVLV